MLIHSVTSHAFGPFANRTLDLADGMTVVIGDNESGKSSWHAAIYAALCGRRRGQGAGTLADREFRARHQPWSGDDWLVTAILSLDDGRRIEMRQDLAGKVKCSATDLATGRDVSDEVMVDGSPDASHWLGLDRSSFVATACVGQAHLLDVRASATGLQSYLQRAATTATADHTAAGAIALIEQFHRKHVGVDRANAVKPLRAAINAQSTAAAVLAGARSDHAEYLLRMDVAEAAGIAEATAKRELRECEAAVAAAEADRLEATAQRAAALHTACGDAIPVADNAGDELDRQVVNAVVGYENRPVEPKPIAPSTAEIDEQIAALPAMPTGDLTPDSSVVAALDGVRRAAMAIDAHAASQRPTTITDSFGGTPEPNARALQERVDDARAATKATNGGLRVPVLVAAALVALAGSALLVLGQPVAGGIALAAGLALGVTAFVARSQVSASAVTRLAQAESALQMAEADARREKEADAAWTARSDALQAAITQACAHLRSALLERGEAVSAENVDDLIAAAEAYARSCAERSAVATQAQRRTSLLDLREAARQAENRAEHDRRARFSATEALLSAARACGLPSDDEESALDGLITWQAKRHDARTAEAVRARQRTELDTILAGRTVMDLVADADRARHAASLLAEDNPRLDIDPAVAEQRLAELRDAAATARANAARSAAEAREFAAHAASVAEAEETLDAADQELQRVRRLERTLDLTQQFLGAAEAEVHRSIAPILNESLSAHLAAVTSGRYTDALVDPDDLSVKVCGTTRNWHSGEQLSFGTTEQIYLLLRAALADHLTRGHDTSPLILDDITVHADAVRTPSILDLLHAVSKDRQVIVFSQEQQVADWARATLSGERDAILELEPVAVA